MRFLTLLWETRLKHNFLQFSSKYIPVNPSNLLYESYLFFSQQASIFYYPLRITILCLLYQLQYQLGQIWFSLVMQTGSVLKGFSGLTTEVIKKELKPVSLSISFICDPDFLGSFSTTETPSKPDRLKKLHDHDFMTFNSSPQKGELL